MKKMTTEQMTEVASLYTVAPDGNAPYEGWTGSNYSHLHGSDLKQAILRELKKCGVKASIRQGRGGYTDRYTITVTVPHECYLTESDYYDATRYNCRVWYTLPDGSFLHQNDIWEYAHRNSADAYRDVIIRTCHDEYVSHRMNRSEKVVIPEYVKMVKAIVDSFNSDHSNAMIDYFDMGFYATYEWKEEQR